MELVFPTIMFITLLIYLLIKQTISIFKNKEISKKIINSIIIITIIIVLYLILFTIYNFMRLSGTIE